MFTVVATAPDGHRIRMGLGQERLEHALEDRDNLRSAYHRHKTLGWTVTVEDADGQTMEWGDAGASVTAGEAL